MRQKYKEILFEKKIKAIYKYLHPPKGCQILHQLLPRCLCRQNKWNRQVRERGNLYIYIIFFFHRRNKHSQETLHLTYVRCTVRASPYNVNYYNLYVKLGIMCPTYSGMVDNCSGIRNPKKKKGHLSSTNTKSSNYESCNFYTNKHIGHYKRFSCTAQWSAWISLINLSSEYCMTLS